MKTFNYEKEKPLLLSRESAHHLLGISSRTLDYLTQRGVLHPVKIGSKTMFKTAEIEHIAEVGYSGKVSGFNSSKL